MEKRNQVIAEILATEKTYVESLKKIEELYMTPLREYFEPISLTASTPNPGEPLTIPAASVPTSGTNSLKRVKIILEEKDYKVIFAGIKTILTVNLELLKQIQEYCDQELNGKKSSEGQKNLGEIFLNLGPYLKNYTTYCNNFDNVVSHIRTIKEKNSRFNDFLEETRKNPKSQGLGLNSLLIQPVQRIPRYSLLLKELISETPKTHRELNQLNQALEKMKEVADSVNSKMKEFESRKATVDVASLISGCPFNLVIPTRSIVFHGELRKISLTKTMYRHYYVFNDLIVYCKNSSSAQKTSIFMGAKGLDKLSKVKYCGSIDLLAKPFMWIRDLPDTGKNKNSFEIVHSKKTWVFTCDTPEFKKEWIENLNSVLKKIAEKEPALLDDYAKVSIGKVDNKLFKLFTIDPASYDKALPPDLPPKKAISSSSLSNEKIDEIKTKNIMEQCVSICLCLYNFTKKREEDIELSFEKGDLLAVFEKSVSNNDKWWVARHIGMKVIIHEDDMKDKIQAKASSEPSSPTSSNNKNINNNKSGDNSEVLEENIHRNSKSSIGIIPACFVEDIVDEEKKNQVMNLITRIETNEPISRRSARRKAILGEENSNGENEVEKAEAPKKPVVSVGSKTNSSEPKSPSSSASSFPASSTQKAPPPAIAPKPGTSSTTTAASKSTTTTASTTTNSNSSPTISNAKSTTSANSATTSTAASTNASSSTTTSSASSTNKIDFSKPSRRNSKAPRPAAATPAASSYSSSTSSTAPPKSTETKPAPPPTPASKPISTTTSSASSTTTTASSSSASSFPASSTQKAPPPAIAPKPVTSSTTTAASKSTTTTTASTTTNSNSSPTISNAKPTTSANSTTTSTAASTNASSSTTTSSASSTNKIDFSKPSRRNSKAPRPAAATPATSSYSSSTSSTAPPKSTETKPAPPPTPASKPISTTTSSGSSTTTTTASSSSASSSPASSTQKSPPPAIAPRPIKK